ncbi:uncharacterized protein F4817DRAFT_368177 [Daldinia loculata]|uniref:uncharacterized protein n=1 Tax=Daldinia loculata TaxID=103429 RepID=UPI0020C45F36|nr:uncharacterized protein F4817DRAFT_368177 [Daldinia loculata]KAI1643720.1 hypothetical protein F4817DRAFT_368177 [Daldinia loculata]
MSALKKHYMAFQREKKNSTAALYGSPDYVYGNNENKPEDNEAFSRDYLTEVASIHARNGIEMYQQIFAPAPYRAALEEMNHHKNRSWVEKYVDGGKVVNVGPDGNGCETGVSKKQLEHQN